MCQQFELILFYKTKYSHCSVWNNKVESHSTQLAGKPSRTNSSPASNPPALVQVYLSPPSPLPARHARALRRSIVPLLTAIPPYSGAIYFLLIQKLVSIFQRIQMFIHISWFSSNSNPIYCCDNILVFFSRIGKKAGFFLWPLHLNHLASCNWTNPRPVSGSVFPPRKL